MSVSFTSGSESSPSSCEDKMNSSCESEMQEEEEEDGLDLDQIAPSNNSFFNTYPKFQFRQEGSSWERCKIHGKKLKFFCLEHNAYICSYCYMVGECNHHQFKFVIDFKPQFKERTRKFHGKKISLLIEKKRKSLRKLLKKFPVPQKQNADLEIFELCMELELLFMKEFKKLDESLTKRPYQALSYKLSEYGNYIKAENPSDIINQDNAALEKTIDEAVLDHKKEINTILNEISQSLEQVLEKMKSEPNIDDCPTLFKQLSLIRNQDVEEIKEIEQEEAKDEEEKEKEKEGEGENRLSQLKKKKNSLPPFLFRTKNKIQIEFGALVIREKSYGSFSYLDEFCNVDTLVFSCQDYRLSDSDLRVFRYLQKKLRLKNFHFKLYRDTAEFDKTISPFFFNPLDVEKIYYSFEERPIWARRDNSKFTGEKLFKCFTDILPQMMNLICFNFNLSESKIDDEFIFLLAQDVLPNLKNLEVFLLQFFSTQVGKDSLLALVQNLPPLKTLRLCFESAISDREVNALAENLKGFNNLEEFTLRCSSPEITDLSVQVLFDNLPETVKSFDLNFWAAAEITDGCIKNFFRFKLPRLQQLESLSMEVRDPVLSQKISKWKQYLEKRKREIEESD